MLMMCMLLLMPLMPLLCYVTYVQLGEVRALLWSKLHEDLFGLFERALAFFYSLAL